MNNFFDSIFSDGTTSTISIGNFLLCLGVSLLLGLVYSFAYSFKEKCSISFKMAMFFLPCISCMIILMVSGNVGIGIAIAGAFSLVRFRSNLGSAKQMCAIFMSMCSGIIAGVGYLAYASLFTLLMCILLIGLNYLTFKLKDKNATRILKITIPESLNYEDVFADLFVSYLASNELVNIRTTNMGTMYKLTYKIQLKDNKNIKQLIDDLRTRNGNLEVNILKEEFDDEKL